MNVLFVMSVFWICYGTMGVFGIQNIPKKYKNTKHEKAYKRFAGIGWVLLGAPLFVLWIVTHNMSIPPILLVFIVFACAIPSLVYTYIGERNFRKQLNE